MSEASSASAAAVSRSEPSALVLYPSGDRFSAMLIMGKDTIAAAATFKPDQTVKSD